jgi:hypothetical protein
MRITLVSDASLRLAIVLALAVVAQPGAADRLREGMVIDGELKGGEVDRYEVELTARTFFHAVFMRNGADVRPPDAGRQALAIFEQILEGWRSLDDFPREVEYARRGVHIRRALNDEYGEAETLLHMASALSTLGNQDRAVDALNRSLALHHAAGRSGPESDVLRSLSLTARGGRSATPVRRRDISSNGSRWPQPSSLRSRVSGR